MKTKKNIKLNLSKKELVNLRKHKIKLSEILDFAQHELKEMLEISKERAKEIHALADFQRIPSIGVKCAEDLFFLGFYSVDQLQAEEGAILRDIYEKRKGFKIDSCVEDQFRLAVHFAKTGDYSKNWWDFTDERKKYRADMGYPKDRPNMNWNEVAIHKE